MRTVAIIQARMGAERLPGKVMLEIAGQTMLERVVRRTQRAATLDRIVVATTVSAADDVVADAARSLGVEVTRGSEEDVLDRFRQAAEEHAADTCVRICADSPLIDPEVCDAAVRAYRDAQPGVDYASNKLEPTYPLGLDVEVFSREALMQAWNSATEDFQRSHVTVHIYQNPSLFHLLPVKADADFHSLRWTVDTPQDLQFATAVFARFGGSNDFGWRDVLELLEREPDLASINSGVRPRELSEG